MPCCLVTGWLPPGHFYIEWFHWMGWSRGWGTAGRCPGGGGGEVASADGQRFRVPVEALHAAANWKYFGEGKGVTYFTFMSDPVHGVLWHRHSRCSARGPLYFGRLAGAANCVGTG
jgi:hypothetical protein